MRLILSATVMSAVMAAAGAAVAEAAGPVIIAHRGGASLRPENTLAAFRHALAMGVPVLEFDMNLTADDEIVLHHDSSVNPGVCRLDKATPIRSMTLAQLRKLDCGSLPRANSPRYKPSPGEKMPSLDEFLDAVKGSGALLLGETKMPGDNTVPVDRFVRLIDAAVRKHGLSGRFILQSSDYRTTDRMRELNPRVRICLLSTRRYKPAYAEVARKHGAHYLMLRLDDASPEQFRALQKAGLKLYSGTSNKPEEWPRYVELGFDGILTDDPAALQEYLKSR